MKCPVENLLLFYASLPEHDENILSSVRELLDRGIDTDYLDAASEAYGVAAGVTALLEAVRGPDHLSAGILRAAEHEREVTVSMRSLYGEVAALLEKEGIPFVPLKGCDSRISSMARRHADPMQDVDILVRPRDITPTGELLVKNGYLHLGSFSGAHMNFATDEDIPRFLEIHWDLVNRDSPVQRRLFFPPIGNIWERCSILCGRLHLSPEDLLCYTAEHAAKEYFRRPKWTADIAWIAENLLPSMEQPCLENAIREWGVSAVLGITAHALASVLPWRSFQALYTAGAYKPGFTGRFVAERLFGYSRLYAMRPLCALAFAAPPSRAISVALGIGERMFRGRKERN